MSSETSSKNSLRQRERILARSFRRIVLSVLASPVAGASAIGCQAPDDVITADASLEDAFDDARAPDAAATRPRDATTQDDAVSCEPVTIVDATFEDVPDGCANFHYLPCGLPPDAQVESCLLDLSTCITICTPPFLYCPLLNCNEGGIIPDAPMIIDCTSCNGIAGRRPLGLCAPRGERRNPVGDYFASMAHLESASVKAFRDLERWLGAFGAPARLQRAANRAAGDERRHARAAARLARRFGGAPRRPRVRRVEMPSLLALLEDDAIEGCVGETFGALLATWQAERAEDPRVRRTLRRIAIDETRHAALAWEILAWGMSRLAPPDRSLVRRTLEEALSATAQRATHPRNEATRRIAGHPAPADERRLARQLTDLVRAGTLFAS